MRLYSFLIVLACWLGLGASFNEAQGNVDAAQNLNTYYHSLSEKTDDGDSRLQLIATSSSKEGSEIHINQSPRHSQYRERDQATLFTTFTQPSVASVYFVQTSYPTLIDKASDLPDLIRPLLYPKHSFW